MIPAGLGSEAPMWRILVTPLFTFWMGLAFVVLFAVIATLAYALVHMLRDERGTGDSIWCPALKRTMRVRAVPSGFAGIGPARFADLRECERYGAAPIECAKPCLDRGEGVPSA
jgi:hypothetical protein